MQKNEASFTFFHFIDDFFPLRIQKKLYFCTGIQKIANHLTQNINLYEEFIN